MVNSVIKLIERFFCLLTRKKIIVKFEDLARTEPISKVFGVDRGMSIDRYYVESFLEKNGTHIKGHVLEVGEDTYTKKFGSNDLIESSSILHVSEDENPIAVIGDLTDISTLEENKYDCFICTQTLNFIYEAPAAVKGIHYLLKPGGVVLVTVVGISQISRYDMDRWGDYWRFTTASMEAMFKPHFQNNLEIKNHGNVLSTVAFLQGLAVEDLPDKSLLDVTDNDYQMVITLVGKK